MSYKHNIAPFIEQSDRLKDLDPKKIADGQEKQLILDTLSRIMVVKFFNFFLLYKDKLGKNLENKLTDSLTLDEKIALNRNRTFVHRYIKDLDYEGEMFSE